MKKYLAIAAVFLLSYNNCFAQSAFSFAAPTSFTTGTSSGTCGALLGGGAGQYFWLNNSCLNAVYDCSSKPLIQTISMNSNYYPAKTSFSWVAPYYPTFSSQGDICGGPRLQIGPDFGGNSFGTPPPTNTPFPTPLAVDSISSLIVYYNISLSENYNINGGSTGVFIDHYLANAPGTGVSLSREFGISFHIDAGSYAYYGPNGGCIPDGNCTIRGTYTDPGNCWSGYIIFNPNGTSGGNTGGEIIASPTNGTDQLKGCVNLKAMYAWLEGEGMLPTGKYLNAIEIVSEIYANTGYWIINCLGIDWNGTIYGSGSC